jgi:antitoxin VapB
MATSSVFTNNRTQAVRLPAELRFPDNVKRVEVLALGRARLIVPAGEAWDAWFDGEGVTPDFMVERDQATEQHRDGL